MHDHTLTNKIVTTDVGRTVMGKDLQSRLKNEKPIVLRSGEVRGENMVHEFQLLFAHNLILFLTIFIHYIIQLIYWRQTS